MRYSMPWNPPNNISISTLFYSTYTNQVFWDEHQWQHPRLPLFHALKLGKDALMCQAMVGLTYASHNSSASADQV